MSAKVIDSKRLVDLVPAVVVVGCGVVAGTLASSPTMSRIALGAGGVAVAAAFALRSPRATLYLLAGWLVVLGTVRRLTTGFVGIGPSLDPLLAIGPLAFAVLAFLAFRAGAFAAPTRLTRAVVVLTVVLAASALNPLQGGLPVGLGGAAAVVIPMLAFFVGRSWVHEETLSRLLGLIAALSVPAAAYGLYQAFFRFPSWDQRWIDNQGYAALNVGGVIRPFGSFASGQEFGLYCAIGLLIVVAFCRRTTVIWFLPVTALLVTAVWYESSRTIIVFLVLAVALTAAARLGWSPVRGLAATLLVLACLPWMVGRLTPAPGSQDSRRVLQEHQVAGLRDPFGERSTLPVHIELAGRGVASVVRNPLGSGVGAVTGAAGKFGGSVAGTEVDIGNAGVAGGVLGLAAYLTVLVLGVRRVYGLAAARRDGIALASLGILVVPGLQWLNGGLYAVIWLPWLVLGWADRPGHNLAAVDAAPRIDEMELTS